jgi:hypothetical protein
VNDQLVPRRIDVRNPAVVAFIVQAGRRDGAVAVLQGRECGCFCGVRPPDVGLELRARAVAAVHAHHPARLLRGVRLHRIFDRAGRRLGVCPARQHRGHSDRCDEPSASEELPACRGQREHAFLAVAIFQSQDLLRLRLRDWLSEAAERGFDRLRLPIRAFKLIGIHRLNPLA